MSDTLKKNLIKYGISGAIALVLAYLFILFRMDLDQLPQLEAVERYLLLCDAFTVPGILFLMSGLMMTFTNMGALDGVGYVTGNGLKMLIPGAGRKAETYGDYLERRQNKKITGFGFLYITGLVCLAISLVFMILFYSFR